MFSIELSNAANGFRFLAVMTGIATFFMVIFAAVSLSENENYAKYLALGAILLALVFLTSGFFAFALK